MNIRDLEAFLAVVEAGSIMGASTQLNLTQPGVSRRIQGLEDTLGVSLLDRQSKPLRPTAEGLQTYEHGRRVLAVLDDLRTSFSREDEIGGEFRIGITPYLSEATLNAPLDALRAAFPKLTLSIVIGWPEQLLERVRRSELDATAFCLPVGMAPPQELECHALGAQPLIVIGAKSDAPQSPRTLRDLSRCYWVMNQDGCAIRTAIRRLFDQDGLPLKIGIEVLQSDLRLSLVARGHGLSLTTSRTLAESSIRAELEIIQVDDFAPEIETWLAHRAVSKRLVRPVGVLRDGLLKAAAS